MQKLFSANQIRKADQFTIENEPITSIDLMERAAKKAKDWILNYGSEIAVKKVSIFSGVGNNGGDGLAIARLLMQKDIEVEVFIVSHGQYSKDFQENLNRLQLQPIELSKKENTFQIHPNSLIIDAIFGTGLSRPVEGFTADVIKKINKLGNQVIAIDIPSGLAVEENQNIHQNPIIKANYTLSFQFPKLSFLFPESQDYVGNWEILDIGLNKDYINLEQSQYYYLQLENIKSIIKSRPTFSHKGTYGHACIVAGSEGKIGAAVLATRACLRSGVGLITVRIPAIGEDILQLSVPEAMLLKDENESELINPFKTAKFSVIGVGPGIGLSKKTESFVDGLLNNINQPMVIDADALNIISKNLKLFNKIPKGSILTPHPKEFKRLVGDWGSDYERLQLQIKLASQYQITVILKGKNTSIATKDEKVYFNSTGNPGMATGGSGDVLTGILTSLLAQGYTSEKASLFGVYLHGLAGDIAAEKLGEEALIASDIIDCLGEGFKRLKSN